MNKLLAIVTIISITVLSVNGQVLGTAVSCGAAAAGGGAATCTGCGANATIQGLFSGVSGAATCKVADCSQAPGSNLNGWMCKSCNGVSGANSAYSTASAVYFQGNACVAACTGGATADSNQICQPPAVPGTAVSCGAAAAGGGAATCTGCGANATIQGLFTGVSGAATCKVTDCSQAPGSNLNGWLCKSCNGVSGANSAYSTASAVYFQGNACVAACTGGATADSNQICQPPAVPGTAVSCGAAAAGGGAATCTGCGANATIQGLFTGVSGAATCKVTDCSQAPGSNLNGWLCKSCNGVSGANSAYSTASAVYFQGNACVAACTGGATADSNQICQPPAVPGTAVSCGAAAAGGGAATCTGCGANATIQGLFTGVSGAATCKVTDCSQAPGSNLNGWLCKSCNGVSGANSAYSTASAVYFQGNACVASCTGGATADSNQICQPASGPAPGSSVSCGTANGSNAATCTGCGANATIQGLFTGDSSASTCKVTDCTLAPAANLNGWMCKSCSGTTGANTAYSAGKVLQGSACAASCNTGYTADSNNICQAGSSSSLLALALSMLLLCLLF